MIERKDLSEDQEKALQHMIKFVSSRDRQMLLAGYAGTGKCLDSNSIIWTSNGLARLKSFSNDNHAYDTEIECDIPVLSFDENTKSVVVKPTSHVWKDSHTDGLEFILDCGYTNATSKWHPIYCEINGIQSYYTATHIYTEFLNGSDIWFPILSEHPSFNTSDYVEISTENKNYIINESIAYIIGCLVGDGTLKTAKYNTVRYTCADSELLQLLLKYGLDNFNDFDICKVGNSKYGYSIKSNDICKIIRYMNISTTSCHKFIPDCIIQSPKHVIISFLSGLFDTDGSSDKHNGYIEYCTCSKQLANDVHRVLLTLGIVSTMKFRSNAKKGAWHIYIRGIYANIFYNHIGFKLTRKQSRMNLLSLYNNTNNNFYPPSINKVMKCIFMTRKTRGVIDNLADVKFQSYGKSNRKASSYYVSYYSGARCPSIGKLNEFIVDTNAYSCDEITNYNKDNKIWLKLKHVSVCDVDLLDLVVPDTHSFIANGMINHNTTILKMFLDYMKENKSGTEIVCTAPTNEAVRVISKTTGEDYSKTIFSLLGLALTYVDDRDPILTQVGSPKIQEYDLVIIDECSMLDHEIVQKIEGVLRQFSYLKVIYIGDDAQLPPILDTKRGINRSIVFGLQNKVQLTEVMRTAKDNPIIGVVTDIRNNLDSPDDIFSRETIINENGDGIQFYDSRDEFMDDMYADFCSESYKTDNNYVRGIAYTNKAIYAMNQQVRKKIFTNDTLNEYEIGENLIVDEPVTERINAKVSKIIYNAGQRLRVLDVSTSADDEYGFRIWDLRVVNYEDPVADQVKRTISVIFKEDVNLYYAALTELANKAKSKLLKQIPGKDGTMRNAYTKSEAWSGYFNFKEGYSWVKYSYCLTSHKSQGSTVKKVYVVERDLNRLTWDDKQRNQLKYVAFTRASNKLNILQ